MARRSSSSVKRLPAEVRELIGDLSDQGRTIDEILAKLRELDIGGSANISRSALGRHVQQLDKIGEEIRRSRAIAEALVKRLGDAPESRTARLNIEIMHSLVMKLLVGEDGEAARLSPQETMFVSTSLQKLAQASKSETDRELTIITAFAKKAAKAAGAAGRKAGISEVARIKIEREILGLAR